MIQTSYQQLSPEISSAPQARADHEFELAVLQEIHARDRVRQRDLAHAVGASLGMTNAIVKRLSKKGLLSLRKVNNRNVVYAVTPSGMEAITRKSYRYLKNTLRSVVFYKDALEKLVLEVRRNGYGRLQLVGKSDLAFVLEHLCGKYGIEFQQSKSSAIDAADPVDRVAGRFVLYAEQVEPDALSLLGAAAHGSGHDYLLRILVAAQAGENA